MIPPKTIFSDPSNRHSLVRTMTQSISLRSVGVLADSEGKDLRMSIMMRGTSETTARDEASSAIVVPIR